MEGSGSGGVCSHGRRKVVLVILALATVAALLLTSQQLDPMGIVMHIADVKSGAVSYITTSNDTAKSGDKSTDSPGQRDLFGSPDESRDQIPLLPDGAGDTRVNTVTDSPPLGGEDKLNLIESRPLRNGDDNVIQDKTKEKGLIPGVRFDSETLKATLKGFSDPSRPEQSSGRPGPDIPLPLGRIAGEAEKQHVFFIKVHKAASSTVQNVILRFAVSRNLTVALPPMHNILSESSKTWLNRVMPLPPGRSHYDILCNHLVFHQPSVRSLLPADAVYIGIVRQPLEQFVSAFGYYTHKYPAQYLKKIPGNDPIATYLRNPSLFDTERPAGSFTHNRMSFDFGLEPHAMDDSRRVSDYLQYLNKTFHLVMVSERFPESMVLMRRTLGWTLKDVLYLKNNVFKHKRRNFTDRQLDTHRRFNMADYMLYEFFSQEFDRKVAAQGPSFLEEVKHYISVHERVGRFCRNQSHVSFLVEQSQWNERFEVTQRDCDDMTREELDFMDYVRGLQYPRRVRRSRYQRSAGDTIGGARHKVYRRFSESDIRYVPSRAQLF